MATNMKLNICLTNESVFLLESPPSCSFLKMRFGNKYKRVDTTDKKEWIILIILVCSCCPQILKILLPFSFLFFLKLIFNYSLNAPI